MCDQLLIIRQAVEQAQKRPVGMGTRRWVSQSGLSDNGGGNKDSVSYRVEPE